jgi:Cadherin domain
VTVRGTRILQGARAVDADQPGPYSTVEYQVLQGPYSDYVDFVNPLEGTLQLKRSLDYEQLKNFTIKLRAQDQGNPPKFSDTFLRVFITDADDQNPQFSFESYTAEFPVGGKTGRISTLPEPLRAQDQDEGIQSEIRYSINPSAESKYFSINPKSGEIELITLYDAQKTTLVIKATQVDNRDRYALVTLTVMRNVTLWEQQASRNDKTTQVHGTSSGTVNFDMTKKVRDGMHY